MTEKKFTKAEVERDIAREQFATFQIEGYVMAGEGMNGEPVPIACTRPEEV